MNLLSPNNVLMTIVLVLLTIALAIIVIPFLIIVAICCLFSYIVMGISSIFLPNRPRESHREGQYRQATLRDDAAAPGAGDDTIECEVISARTVEHEESAAEDR